MKAARGSLMALAALTGLACLWLAVQSLGPPARPLALAPLARGIGATVPATGPMNVNAASREQLMTLPGIGPQLAQAIIGAREACPFFYPEDLRGVPGIGERRLAAVLPLICAEPLAVTEGGL